MKEHIESGRIGKKVAELGREEVDYDMGFLDESYLGEVVGLQELIVPTLSHPDLLKPFSPDFMRLHFEEKGRVVGVFSGGDLVAFRAIYFPDIDDPEWNLGLDLGLPEDELGRVANLQMICVHPEFRGNHLALRMNRQSIKWLKQQEKYLHLCATVHPHNHWNVSILLNSGFIIRKLSTKYGGLLRYVVYQNLVEPVEFAATKEVIIGWADIEDQKEALKEGFVGTGINRHGKGFKITFKR